MTIINAAMINQELPDGSSVSQGVIDEADSFVKNATSRVYDTWDDYLESTKATTAPGEIVRLTKEITKAMYFLSKGQTNRSGTEHEYWSNFLKEKKLELSTVQIQPTWYTQTVALNSNYCMLIGKDVHDTGFSGTFYRIIPASALLILTNQASTDLINGYDFQIRKGLYQNSEFTEGWYFELLKTSATTTGSLKVLRTYRNDGVDYQKYSVDINRVVYNKITYPGYILPIN